MPHTWKIVIPAPRRVIEAALLAHEDAFDWDPDIVIAGYELADPGSSPGQAGPEDWQLEAWLPRRPTVRDRAAISGLFVGGAPPLAAARLPETDWVTQSQQGLEPIRAGRFHVRTPGHAASPDPALRDFVIPASQAFGTGHHATTAGCLAMLSHMKARGLVVRNLADIGAGTGLLAFAAMHLWPQAMATASDIDPVCLGPIAENARANGVRMGARPGELTMLVAGGMDHPLLDARGPYDLVIANILAGPLIALAPDFAQALVPGGSLVLSGLLESQEAAVRAACRRAGFRLAARLVRGDWSVLWLRKRQIAAMGSL